MKKLLALFLAAVMVFSFASCGKKTVQETDLSKPITLHWLMPGPGIQQDAAKVWAKFNEELHKKKGFENVTVEIEVIPFSDYSQKFLLMRTSDEPMDIVQTYTLDYATEYRNGSFLDLTDYLQFAETSLKELPDWVVDMGKVDGQQAIIPNYQKMVAAPWSITLPKDLADKYADVDAISKSVLESDIVGDETFNEMMKYAEKVKAAGELGTGYTGIPVKGFDSLIKQFVYRTYTDNSKGVKVEFSSTAEGSWNYNWKTKNEAYKKGYVRKDALSAKSDDSNGIKGGNINWQSQAWHDSTPFVNTTSYDIPVVQIPLSKTFFIPYQPAAGGFAIASNSQYPDVAMKIIDLMQSKEGMDLYNLMVYGIEGEHYDVIEDLADGDKYIKPRDYEEEGTSSARYGLPKWVVGNAKNAYVTANQEKNFKEFIYDYMNEGKDTKTSPLMGFAPNTDPIEVKLQQVNAVHTEYGNVLGAGVTEFQPYYDEYIKKVKLAGSDDIVAELQKQVDEFYKNK